VGTNFTQPAPSIRVRIRHYIRKIIPHISLERRAEVQVLLRQSSSPDFDFFLLVVLSCVIATLGLMVDSPAVIIGAMLVAPLMSPIIGLGLASITGDSRLLRDAATALLRGAFLAILISFILTWLNNHLPFIMLQVGELPVEITSRTQPTPLDMGIAMAGGLAAAFALVMPNISAALPGVAIATALMPPLCTIGIGLALGQWNIAGGASLLFITNLVTIAFASTLVLFTLGFSPRSKNGGNQLPRSLLISALLTVATLIPLTLLSIQFVRNASQDRTIQEVITQKLKALNNADLVEWNSTQDAGKLKLNITVRTDTPLRYEDSVRLQKEIATGLRQGNVINDTVQVEVVINQVLTARLDPLIPPTYTPTPTQTYTSTPGPSPTATDTPLPTATATATATGTPTVTPTFTPTATNTRTPVPALISGVVLPGMRLRQSPNGPVIGALVPGKPLTLLYGRSVVDGLVWLEVMDYQGRVGWVPQIYLITITPPAKTSTALPTATPSLLPSQPASITPTP
jgi:uncharacterized hydrophobic protein (TIGR00271 family)